MGISFPRSTAPRPPVLRPLTMELLFHSAHPPSHILPQASKITFTRSLKMELLSRAPPLPSKITCLWPLVTTTVYHVFFYSFKQNLAYSLLENSFQQKVF